LTSNLEYVCLICKKLSKDSSLDLLRRKLYAEILAEDLYLSEMFLLFEHLSVFNLALADLLFIVFCVPFTATDYSLPSWPFGGVWCKIVQYLVIVTAYASVYTLVFMSIDR
jgi:hypothetical protein